MNSSVPPVRECIEEAEIVKGIFDALVPDISDSSSNPAVGTLLWAKSRKLGYWPSIVVPYLKKTKLNRTFVYLLGVGDKEWVLTKRLVPLTEEMTLEQIRSKFKFRIVDNAPEALSLAYSLLEVTHEHRMSTLGLDTHINAGPKKRKKRSANRPGLKQRKIFEILDQLDSSNSNTDDGQLLTDDKYPVGSIVWAKLEGFPYWPSIVETAKSNGLHRQLTKSGGLEYFCKFLGWNGDHAWIKRILPWSYYLDHIQDKTTLYPFEKKRWCPSSAMKSKWQIAFEEAEMLLKNAAQLDQGSLVNALPVYSEAGVVDTSQVDQVRDEFCETDLCNETLSSESTGGANTSLLIKPEDENVLLPGWHQIIDNDTGSARFRNAEGLIFTSKIELFSYLFRQNSVDQKCFQRRRTFSTSDLDTKSSGPVRHGCGWLQEMVDRVRVRPEPLTCVNAGPLDGAVEYFQDRGLPLTWTLRVTKRGNKRCQIYLSADGNGFFTRLCVLEHLSHSVTPSHVLEFFLTGQVLPKSIHHKLFEESPYFAPSPKLELLPYSDGSGFFDHELNQKHPMFQQLFLDPVVELSMMPISIFEGRKSVGVKESWDFVELFDLKDGHSLARSQRLFEEVLVKPS